MLENFEKRHIEEYRAQLIELGKMLDIKQPGKQRQYLINRMKITNELLKALEEKDV